MLKHIFLKLHLIAVIFTIFSFSIIVSAENVCASDWQKNNPSGNKDNYSSTQSATPPKGIPTAQRYIRTLGGSYYTTAQLGALADTYRQNPTAENFNNLQQKIDAAQKEYPDKLGAKPGQRTLEKYIRIAEENPNSVSSEQLQALKDFREDYIKGKVSQPMAEDLMKVFRLMHPDLFEQSKPAQIITSPSKQTTAAEPELLNTLETYIRIAEQNSGSVPEEVVQQLKNIKNEYINGRESKDLVNATLNLFRNQHSSFVEKVTTELRMQQLDTLNADKLIQTATENLTKINNLNREGKYSGDTQRLEVVMTVISLEASINNFRQYRGSDKTFENSLKKMIVQTEALLRKFSE